VLVALAVVGLGYFGFQEYRRSQPEECYACQRAVHAHSRTIALVNGKPRVFCCPACALSEGMQEGKPIQVTELTAFLSGAKLLPDHAFIVKGSDVNMCAHNHEMMSADKREAGVHFDRCAPSLIAFGERSEAAEFARQHGGEVASFSEIVSKFGH
jgi:hypothetical protein